MKAASFPTRAAAMHVKERADSSCSSPGTHGLSHNLKEKLIREVRRAAPRGDIGLGETNTHHPT